MAAGRSSEEPDRLANNKMQAGTGNYVWVDTTGNSFLRNPEYHRWSLFPPYSLMGFNILW